jgi:hypothetical protein
MWRLGAIFFPKTSGFFFFARLRKFAEINNNNHNIVGLLSWIGLVGPSLAPGVSPGLLVFLRPRSSLAMLQRCRYFYCGTICFPSIVSLALHLSVESSTLSPLSPIVFLHQKISWRKFSVRFHSSRGDDPVPELKRVSFWTFAGFEIRNCSVFFTGFYLFLFILLDFPAYLVSRGFGFLFACFHLGFLVVVVVVVVGRFPLAVVSDNNGGIFPRQDWQSFWRRRYSSLDGLRNDRGKLRILFMKVGVDLVTCL